MTKTIALQHDLAEPLKLKIKSELFNPLNSIQREAVEHKEGPLLILAGAGSGKTRVITHRIAHLVRIYGVAPWNIAAVTFTNKAVEEMRRRLEDLIGPLAPNVFVRTFHSLGLHILRRNPEALGLTSPFSIVDQGGQKSLIKTILKEEKLEQSFLEPASIASQINMARDAMLSPEAFASSNRAYSEELTHLYKLYIRRLRKNNSVDFGDLLYESVRLLEKNPDLRKSYGELWRCFLIDEYQDTNRAQYRLGSLITKEHKNLMVVGDDDQSIYSWRGADIRNILNFEKDHPRAKILKLEENYRSTAVILQAASSLIANNSQRRAKTLFTKQRPKEESAPIFYQSYENENSEAYGVVQKILSYRARGIPLGQMAIFYRTNAQSRVFERILRENRLPYVIVGDIRFYERKEIKDILAYLSVIVNPEDELSLERIINVPPRGLGQTGLERLRALALSQNKSLLESLLEVESIPNLRSHKKLKSLYKLFQDCRKQHMSGVLPSEITEKVLEDSGYLELLKKEASFDSEARIGNLSEFISSLHEYEEECRQDSSRIHNRRDIAGMEILGALQEGENDLQAVQANLGDFLQRIALSTNEKGEKAGSDSHLYLMTLHNAKGLEYNCVFLCGIEEGYLPHSLSIDEGNIEEERRLLYVGITRARERLHISCAQERRIFSSLQPRRPSQFIEEIDCELFSEQNSFRSKRERHQKADRLANLENYSQGEEVYHQRYGRGTILKTEKMPIGQKLSIQFEFDSSVRCFLSQYSPLSRSSL